MSLRVEQSVTNQIENQSKVSKCWTETNLFQTLNFGVAIYPRYSLMKSVSVAAAAKAGTGSDVIKFFQVNKSAVIFFS